MKLKLTFFLIKLGIQKNADTQNTAVEDIVLNFFVFGDVSPPLCLQNIFRNAYFSWKQMIDNQKQKTKQ